MDMINLGKAPLEDANPVGFDVSYDPEFEELQAEIDKLSSPSASVGVDWDKVTRLASSILSSKSKDLRAAVYLSVALAKTRKAEGALTGVRLCKDLIEDYWDTLFPPKKRLRGRINALRWWMERIEAMLQQDEEFGSGPTELAEQLGQEIEALGHLMQEHVPDAPSLRPLRDLLKRITPPQEGSPTQEPTPAADDTAETGKPREGPPAKPSPAQTEAVPKVTAAQDLHSPQEVKRALNELFTQTRSLAGRLNEVDSANALGYRLRRFTLWAGVDVSPPSTGGRTKIPPPPDQVRKAIKELQNQGNWDSLIKTAETRLSQHIFWLDLNRFTAMALHELGSRFHHAAETIARETAYLLLRLPQLEELSFSDGTPFADQQTKQWLEENSLKAVEGGSAGMAPLQGHEPAGSTRAEELVQEAFEHMKEGRVLDGLQILQSVLDKAASQRERFQYRVTLCRYLLSAKKARHIQPHVDFLFQTMDTHHLDEWEPALAAEALKTIYTGLRTQKSDSARAVTARAFERLARIDPSAAFSLDQS